MRTSRTVNKEIIGLAVNGELGIVRLDLIVEYYYIRGEFVL